MNLDHRAVRVLGYVSLGFAIINTVAGFHKSATDMSDVYNPGIALANEAMAMLGVIAIVVAHCLQKLEKRLPPRE